MGYQQRRFRQRDHICALYRDPEQQYAVAAAYIADGLRCREQCLYAAGSDHEFDHFRRALCAEGIAADHEERTGALLMKTSAETHLAGGHFDGERMLHMLSAAVESALDAGFTGLRTCGDMSWLLDHPAGADQVVEYEALLNSFFADVRALGMCQYDRARLPAQMIDHALATHPRVTMEGVMVPNTFYRPAPIALTRTPTPGDVDWKIRELRQRPAEMRIKGG